MSGETQDTGRVLVKNAADVEQVRYAERKTKDRASRELQLWRAQLSTPDGREFIWSTLRHFGLFESGVGLSADALFALEGRRDVGRRWWSFITSRLPREFLTMQREAMDRDERDARGNAAARTAPAASEK